MTQRDWIEGAFLWGILVGWATYWLKLKAETWGRRWIKSQDAKLRREEWKLLKSLNKALKP